MRRCISRNSSSSNAAIRYLPRRRSCSTRRPTSGPSTSFGASGAVQRGSLTRYDDEHPPLQARRELAADGLDLGQLGHGGEASRRRACQAARARRGRRASARRSRRRRRAGRRGGGRRGRGRRRAAARARACGRCRDAAGRSRGRRSGRAGRRAAAARASAPTARVDLAQRRVEALDVLAVAVDLVGLDQVREHEAVVELAPAGDVVVAIASAFVAPGCASSMPRPANSCATLPTAWTGTPRRLQRVEVAAATAARARSRAGAACARSAPGLAVERPRDHAPDRVLAVHQLPHARAGLVQLLHRHGRLVRGDLQDGVLRGVDDQRARGAAPARRSPRSRRARRSARCTSTVAPGDPLDRRDDLRREAVRVGRRRRRARRRPSAPSARSSSPCRGPARAGGRAATGSAAGATPSSGRIEPSPSASQRRQRQPAGGLREMSERVRAGVAVVGGVGQRADAAGVEHDDERAAAHRRPQAGRSADARGCAAK